MSAGALRDRLAAHAVVLQALQPALEVVPSAPLHAHDRGGEAEAEQLGQPDYARCDRREEPDHTPQFRNVLALSDCSR